MKNLLKVIKETKLITDKRGATLVEYILMVGFVALLASFAFKTFGQSVSSKINTQASAVNGINDTAASGGP